MLNCTVSNKIETNKTRHNLPLSKLKSRMKKEENKPSGSKIFANYAAQIRGDAKKWGNLFMNSFFFNVHNFEKYF